MLKTALSEFNFQHKQNGSSAGGVTIAEGYFYLDNRKSKLSNAKPQNGSTVKGYRTLWPKEIDDINELKQVSLDFCILLEKQKAWVQEELQMTGNHSAEAHEAARCLSIAPTKMQEACMWACRAVARPDADC